MINRHFRTLALATLACVLFVVSLRPSADAAQQRTLQYSGTPTNGQTVTYNSTTKVWEPATIAAGTSLSDTYANVIAYSAPFEGLRAYPTDGGHAMVYTGGAWNMVLRDGTRGLIQSAATFSNHINWAGATALTNSYGTLVMTCGTSGSIQFSAALASFTPGSTYGVRGLLYTIAALTTSGAIYPGLVLRESATGKAIVWYATSVASYWASPTSRTGYITTTTPGFYEVNTSYMPRPTRIKVTAGTASFDYLDDDKGTWISTGTMAISTAFTTGPDQWGFGFVTSASGDGPMYVPDISVF